METAPFAPKSRVPFGRYLAGFGVVVALFSGVTLATLVGIFIAGILGSENVPASLRAATNDLGESCNVVGLELHGCIETYGPNSGTATDWASLRDCDAVTSSQDIIEYIDDAVASGKQGILLDIDSPGGMPAAAAEIAHAIQASGLPTVAWIRGYGDSAAYWSASAASFIVATPVSDVGSIGVTQSYLDSAKQNENQGLTYNDLSTGKFKDTGSPDKALSADERSYLKKQLEQILDQFVATVATNRHLDESKVRAIADGSTYIGTEALNLGLIDAIGFKEDALAKLQELTKSEPHVCWPQYDN